MQRVFIVDLEAPWQDIREVECEIISGKKFTWAETPRGRRHLLGSSAFFMRKSAEHSQRDRVRAVARNGALQWIAPYRMERARLWLGTFAAKGLSRQG
jgi:hypothetical protein